MSFASIRTLATVALALSLLTAGGAAQDVPKALALLEQAKLALTAAPAYATALTDRLPRAKPPLPTIGAAGSSFTDPTFGSRILRVTDDKTAAGASWHVPSNAHLAAWNADSTTFYVIGNAGKQVYHVDPAVFTVTAIGPVTSQPEPQFSRVDPDVLFVGGGNVGRTLQRYSLSKKTYTDVLDLDALGLPLANPRTYCGGIYSSAAPEVLVAIFGGEQADLHHYVVWQPLDGRPRKVLDTLNTPAIGARFRLHSGSVDLSGRYVVLYPPGLGATDGLNPAIAKKVIWDTQTDTFTLLPEAGARMGGHDALGVGTMINMEGASVGQPWDAAQWVARTLAAPLVMTDLITQILTPKETTLEDHTTWNNAKADRLVPVISSTFHSGPITGWRAWDDEIIAIEPKAGGTVWRFAHHRSVIDPNQFWTQPLINVDPSGRFAIFTSTWENTLGADPDGGFRRDVFLVALR